MAAAAAVPVSVAKDPNSFANNASVRVASFDLVLTAHFDKKVLVGHVDLSVEVVAAPCNAIVLDTKTLTINSVTNAASGETLEHKLGDVSEAFGQSLTISLPQGTGMKAGDIAVIRVAYATSPDSSAIQWLPPSQTAGKQHPYLFTQCQAIHARALLPCQDTPGNKCPYSATVTVPAPLTALMSALRDGSKESEDKKSVSFSFQQPVPMPSYLVALGIGHLESRKIGPRTLVWSEKEMVDKGAFEFAETEKFLKTAEDIVGEYVWGQYDILLLPPSFPYGGMENPCLTFVTPTLLAGDRSLANVVAHEIAHSWMGNLVSPTTWEHFWMNEGFTVFLERKIIRAMYGDKVMHLQAILGWNALKDSVNHFKDHPDYTCLVPKLDGVDPDDAFSSVPYEKGFNFLFYLEGLVGGPEKMNPFLKAHCEKFKFACVDSYQWKDFFLSYFADKVDAEKLKTIDWDMWYKGQGMPPTPKFDTTLVDTANALADQIMEGKVPEADVKSWTCKTQCVFLERLHELQTAATSKPDADKAALNEKFASMNETLDQKLGKVFSSSQNAEIRFRWYSMNIAVEREAVFPAATAFLAEVGRMKFVRPLYRQLYASAKGKDLAVATFKKLRSNYHNICSKMVAKDLGL